MRCFPSAAGGRTHQMWGIPPLVHVREVMLHNPTYVHVVRFDTALATEQPGAAARPHNTRSEKWFGCCRAKGKPATEHGGLLCVAVPFIGEAKLGCRACKHDAAMPIWWMRAPHDKWPRLRDGCVEAARDPMCRRTTRHGLIMPRARCATPLDYRSRQVATASPGLPTGSSAEHGLSRLEGG